MAGSRLGGGQVVTIVFVDLVNSTAIKAALPGVDITARNRAYLDTILIPHRERVEADLAAFGGRVVKTAGDDHFLVFANAAQAAEWAVALQTRDLTDPIATPLGALQIRIGMHTGAPLTDPGAADDYVGHEVDTAKRISDLAEGGQILLSETTAALVRDAGIAGLVLHSHGARLLKGIGSVSLVELLYGGRPPRLLGPGVVVRPSRHRTARDEEPPSRDREGADTALTAQERSPTTVLLEALAGARIVGRETELAEMKRHVDAALQGAGATVMLAGEPGIGKTRLATEASEYARRHGFRVLTGRCEEEGAALYQPFAEVVLDYLNTAESWHVQQTMPPPVACELVRIVPQIARQQEVPQVPPMPAEQARHALIEAAHQFFAFLATHDAPLLLLLDDLQWADEGSLALLHALARHARDLPLLIVGTYRDVELDTRHPLERTLTAMNRERLQERLRLRRLSEAGVAQMVGALLDQPSSRREFVTALYQETEGNPFYVEEVLKHLVEEGAIYRGQDHWQIKPLEEFSVPQSIKVTIGRRLQRLGEESRETLALAAVIGQQFSFEALLQASGQSEDRLLDSVEEWLRAHLVVEQRFGREEVYRFHHAQIRAVLYDEPSLRRKARLHERVGLALEAVYAGSLDAHLDELAHHFSQSRGGPAVEKAIDYCRRAGERALRLYANEEAIRHLTAALELLDGLPDDVPHLRTRCQVVEPLAVACFRLGESKRAGAVLQDCLTLAEGVGDAWSAAAAHLALARHGHVEPILHLEQCLEICRRHGLTDLLPGASIRLASHVSFWSVQPDSPRAEALLRRALEAAPSLSRNAQQAVYGNLMEICAFQGKWEDVTATLRESLSVGGPSERGLVFALASLECALGEIGEQSKFLAFTAEAERLLAEAGIRFPLSQWHLEPAQPSEQFRYELFYDDFDALQLRPEWHWHDPIQASRYSLSDRPGYLTIHSFPGTDLHPGLNLNGPRLLLEISGDFALETRMEGDWRQHNACMSGLLIWKDVLNFLRFNKSSMSNRHRGQLAFEGAIQGDHAHWGRGRLEGETYTLRLERTGSRVVALCSADGATWYRCGEVTFPAADPLQVGVFAIAGMVAHFDTVRLLGRDPGG